MPIAEKIVDYLRGVEVTEPELISIYEKFGKQTYNEGFNEGCEFIRGLLRRQRIHRKQKLQENYSRFLTKLDDHLHAVQ